MVTVDVIEEQNSIDINDVNVSTIHVHDLSPIGTIQVEEIESQLSADDINTSTTVTIIELPSTESTTLQITDNQTATVTIPITETSIIEITDDISIVTAATEAASDRLRGFIGDSVWDGVYNSDIHYNHGNVGIGNNLNVDGIVSGSVFVGIFKGALSSSAQIATDISGAFTATTTELQNLITANTSTLSTRAGDVNSNTTTININTARLGQIEITTGSLLTSVNNLITNSSSFSTRITSLEEATITLPSNLISSSAQIAADISGSFNNLNFSDGTETNVVVYDPTTKNFSYTSSYSNTGTGGDPTAVQYTTSSIDVNLTKLIVKDFSNDVSVVANGGILELIFGSPSLPYFNSFAASGFNTNRFDLINDDYTLVPSYNLNSTTFISGSISSSNVGLGTFNNGESFTIDSNFPSFRSGSHSFTVNVTTQLADGSTYIISDTTTVSLNKLNPTSPSVTNIVYDVTLNAFRSAQNEIEEGATGDITWSYTAGTANGSNGWEAATPANSSFDTTLDVNATGNVTTGTVEQYWTSGTNNSTLNNKTGSVSKTWTRVRSLRYLESTNQLSLSEAFLQNLSNWSNGTIKSGFNTQSEIESCTITFNPTPAAPKYLYIVYDNDRGSVNKVLNTDSTYNENDGVNWLNETHGNYKVYYTSLPKDATLNYKLEF